MAENLNSGLSYPIATVSPEFLVQIEVKPSSLQDFLLFLAPPKLWIFHRSFLSKVNAMEDENIHLQLLPSAQWSHNQ